MKIVFTMVFVLASCWAFAQDVVFGTYPSNSPETIYKAFSLVTDYLSKETGYNVKLVVTKDYTELAERVENGTVDFAWIGSVNYVKLKNKVPGVKYLATYAEKSAAAGKVIPYYQAYIISLKSSGINTIEDAKGKMFAYVDKDSTSGYAYPKMMLENAGILDSNFFKKVYFMKKHDRVLEAVIKRSIDVGAVSDGTYVNGAAANGDVFNILMKSDPIPLDAVIAAPNVQKNIQDKIQKALLKIPENHEINKSIKEIIGWPAAGFIKKSDSFYDGLRQALKL